MYVCMYVCMYACMYVFFCKFLTVPDILYVCMNQVSGLIWITNQESLRNAPWRCPVTNRDFSFFFQYCSDDDLGAIVDNMKVFETAHLMYVLVYAV